MRPLSETALLRAEWKNESASTPTCGPDQLFSRRCQNSRAHSTPQRTVTAVLNDMAMTGVTDSTCFLPARGQRSAGRARPPIQRSVTAGRLHSANARTRGESTGAARRRDAAIAEVRELGRDTNRTHDGERSVDPHEAILERLRGFDSKVQANRHRRFLDEYRSQPASAANDAKLDKLIEDTNRHAEELRERAEHLQLEAKEAERRMEQTSAQTVTRATDMELQSLDNFARSRRRMQEDKKEEELHRIREEANMAFTKLHHKLQGELIELRDTKVLIREFRRIRLEKVQDAVLTVKDGRQLRACVRDMIRYGAQRIIQRLETSSFHFDSWMIEVLVNCSHIEIRIEDAEKKLLGFRRKALEPMRADVQDMCSQTTQERLERLRAHAWEERNLNENTRRDSMGFADTIDPVAARAAAAAAAAAAALIPKRKTMTGTILETKIHDVETEIANLRRLLTDTRNNAAAVICTQIRQSEKAGGRMAGHEAMDWGGRTLALLFSEDFAKKTMKELEKSRPEKVAPQANFGG